MFSKLWCARVCYAIFLGSKNATLHSKIEHTANHFTVIQTLRVSKSTFSLIEIILKVHIHLSMTHRVSRMQNQEIKNFSTTYPSPNRGAVSTGATGAMAPVDFEKLCFGTYEIIIKVHFWARFLSNS